MFSSFIYFVAQIVTHSITITAKQVVLISGLLFGSGSATSSVAEIVVSETAFNDGYFYFLDSIGYVQVSAKNVFFNLVLLV